VEPDSFSEIEGLAMRVSKLTMRRDEVIAALQKNLPR